MLIFEIQV